MYAGTHRLAKRASNYRRDRRVIRALMSADGGLLAAKTKRKSDNRKRERQREKESFHALEVMLRTDEENERDEERQ